MDTISNENGGSGYSSIAAIIIGVLALIVSIIALVKLSSVNRQVSMMGDASARIDSLESSVRSAVSTAETASRRVADLSTHTQRAFEEVSSQMGALRTTVNRVDLALKEGGAPRPTTPPPATTSTSAGGSDAPADSGADGTYTIRSGDTLSRIAQTHGVSLDALLNANPGIEPTRLRVGQQINLPRR